MAYKRKYTKKYTPRKKYRSNTWSGASIPRPIARGAGVPQIVRITRTCKIADINFNNTTQFAAYNFKLTQLPNNTQFSLYDQYRIRFVKVYFVNNTQPCNQSALDNQVAPTLVTAVDWDDSTTPTSMNQLYSFHNCKIHGSITAGSPYMSRTFKPAVAKTVFGSGITNAFGASRDVWLDVASSQTEHYGLKLGLEQTPQVPASSGSIRVYATFYMEFKSPV